MEDGAKMDNTTVTSNFVIGVITLLLFALGYLVLFVPSKKERGRHPKQMEDKGGAEMEARVEGEEKHEFDHSLRPDSSDPSSIQITSVVSRPMVTTALSAKTMCKQKSITMDQVPSEPKAQIVEEAVVVASDDDDEKARHDVPPELSTSKEIPSAEPKPDSKFDQKESEQCMQEKFMKNEIGNSGTYWIPVRAKKENEKFLLGGYHSEGFKNMIPSSLNYSYAKWPRKHNLQDPCNYCLMFRSADAERIFHRLWNDGDFNVEVELLDDKSSKYFFKWELLPFDDDDINLLDEGGKENAMMFLYHIDKSSKTPVNFRMAESTSNRMKSMFTQRQLEALRIRITHRLFRECGSLFSEFWRNTILEHLAVDCKHRGYWYDMIDIGMIFADIAIHFGSPIWDQRMIQVAFAVQTKGKFGLAAQIYEDLLMIMKHPDNFPTFLPTNFDETTILFLLGESHRFNGDWDSSLKAFVEAMHMECRKRQEGMLWNLNVIRTRAVILRFGAMLLYFAHKDGGIDKAKLYFMQLAGLLSKAGYDAEDFGEFCPLFRLCERQISISNQSKANQYLCMLFKSPHVEDFHSNLIRCNTRSVGYRLYFPIPGLEDTLFGKKHAEDETRTGPLVVGFGPPEESCMPITPSHCDNPSCQEKSVVHSRLRDCSKCHIVRYCSKECQVQHWLAHKRECKKWCKEGQKSMAEK